jgi:anion transporter
MQEQLLGIGLGPIIGVLIWLLPLSLDPVAHKAFAITGFMLVYWIMEPIDHGITALMGCYLFWALQVVPFSVAFSGFANSAPWYIFGALLMGEAAARTGLANRLGYVLMRRIGTSYRQLLFGIITLTFLLNFLIPSPNALLATIAPVVVGLITVFNVGPRSNLAKGLFVILAYNSGLSGKMILGGSGSTLLARGIMEEQTGLQVLWSQWLLAFLPAILLTILASWVTIRWLYPAEIPETPGGPRYLDDALRTMGPWTRAEKQVLAWFLLAIGLWATAFFHHLNPAVIALGIGLLLTLPKLGVLDAQALKSLNFLQIILMAGGLSMGNTLLATNALDVLAAGLAERVAPLLSGGLSGAITLYWGGFLYHFLMPGDNQFVTTGLPLLFKLIAGLGINPLAVGMIWAFAAGGKLLVYQSNSLVLGYSFGYFEGKDVLKVGTILTLVEGLILMVLVPLYWPLIGLPWRVTPAAQVATAAPAAEVAPAPDGDMAQALSAPGRRTTPRPEAAVIRQAQERLTQLGFAPGPLDGRLGPQTDSALRRFQAASGVPVSGRLDRATIEALGVTPGEPAAARSRSEPSPAPKVSLFTPPATSTAFDPRCAGGPCF